MSADGGRFPLTPDEFAELEKSGGRELSSTIRAALNSHIFDLCGRKGDRLLSRHRSRSSRSREQRQLPKDLSRLARDSERLRTKFEALRQWIYHRNALMHPLFNAEEASIDEALAKLIQRARRESTNEYLFHRTKPGPKKNEWYRRFFFGVADVFDQAGGKVSAASQRDKGGRNNSPFIRFIRKLHEYLPSKRRELVPKALGEWAHSTGIPEWKTSRQG